jgi:hypothetical protein
MKNLNSWNTKIHYVSETGSGSVFRQVLVSPSRLSYGGHTIVLLKQSVEWITDVPCSKFSLISESALKACNFSWYRNYLTVWHARDKLLLTATNFQPLLLQLYQWFSTFQDAGPHPPFLFDSPTPWIIDWNSMAIYFSARPTGLHQDVNCWLLIPGLYSIQIKLRLWLSISFDRFRVFFITHSDMVTQKKCAGLTNHIGGPRVEVPWTILFLFGSCLHISRPKGGFLWK